MICCHKRQNLSVAPTEPCGQHKSSWLAVLRIVLEMFWYLKTLLDFSLYLKDFGWVRSLLETTLIDGNHFMVLILNFKKNCWDFFFYCFCNFLFNKSFFHRFMRAIHRRLTMLQRISWNRWFKPKSSREVAYGFFLQISLFHNSRLQIFSVFSNGKETKQIWHPI